jgi:polyhydroxyalkanoate synthesis regulator phasin
MEKIIKRTISLTTKKRDSRNKLFEEFYSHDKNNAVFEFTVEGGVPTEEIVVLFHFKRTNRHLEVRGRVDNDKIIVNFDTSLIIKDEQVAGYIYYENGEKSNDVYRFMFDVHVSEIDKEHDLPIMEQESKRIVPLTDIVTKSEITELLKKIVANEKLYDDSEIKQQIESKADKETVQAISSKVDALENNSGNSTTYDDAEIRGQIAIKADTQAVEAIAQRVQTLENKPDNDTVYNDTELRQAIEKKAEKEALLQYLPKSELTPISEKIESIETNIGRMATQQQLESYVSKNELEQKGYLTSADTRNFALKSEIPVATNLDAINEKIKTLEEKQPIDLSHLATKKEIEDSHYLTREDITGLATNSKVEAVESRVQQLENKPPVDLSNLATKQEIEDVVKTTELTKVTERVQSLEARPQIDASTLVTKDELDKKGYLTTAPDLSEYAKKSEMPPQFDSQPLTERINALEAKATANGAYNDKPLLDKIREVQESLKGFITQSSRYLVEHQSLAHLVTKDELARTGYINAHQSLEHLVTKEELENKHYLTNQDISNLATNSKVEAVETRVQTLENKPPVDLSNLATKQELEAVRNSQPTVDTSNLVTKQELEDKHYLSSVPEVDTSHFVTRDELDSKHYIQDVSNLATNAKVDAVEARVQTIENKPAVDLSPFVTKQELEAKQYLKDHQPLDGYVKKSELPPQIDTSTLVSKQELTSMNLVNAEALGEVSKKMLEQKTKITALEEKAGYEIHGTGMPNGRVTAPIGTTYVDTAVTNGALKWIKESGDGDRGWKVFTGDTGWRTLPLLNKRGDAKLQIRRVNDQVIVKFDGLSWGWFGVDDISKQGGRIVDKTIDGKKYTWIKLDVGKGNDVLPVGFRSASSLLSGLYGDLGDLLGSVYVGGTDDSNAIQLRYAMPKEQITSNILSQIRISPITFITDDDYPTTLP